MCNVDRCNEEMKYNLSVALVLDNTFCSEIRSIVMNMNNE